MNVNQTSAYGASNSSQSSNQLSTQQTDSNMFMTLLVAQLKNQDPLEPQDGTQFVAQLAQFNSLDQLIGIRQAMEQMVAAINTPAPTTTTTTTTGDNPNSSTKNRTT